MQTAFFNRRRLNDNGTRGNIKKSQFPNPKEENPNSKPQFTICDLEFGT
jgi:hypothetical protein